MPKSDAIAIKEKTIPTSVETLDLLGSGLSNEDIEPLKHCVNLKRLSLHWNEISDISPLAGLSQLRTLDLGNNNISDIAPLTGLTLLETLELRINAIRDIEPLSALPQLVELDLAVNSINDISPIGGLSQLERLDLCGNMICDIAPLAGLAKLASLDLSANGITSIKPLNELKRLTSLYLGDNKIRNILPLAGLTLLTDLSLSDNKISDITPLSGLERLTKLEIDDNKISDITALADLSGLRELNAGCNMICDIAPLAGLTELVKLGIAFNQIYDVGALAGLLNLRKIFMTGNRVTKIDPLTKLPHIIIEEDFSQKEQCSFGTVWNNTDYKEYVNDMDETIKLAGITGGVFGESYILDLETTGLDPASEEIIEIGALKLNRSGNVEQRLELLVKLPDGKEVSDKITELTGITNEMLAESGVLPEDAASRLREFIWAGKDTPAIVAHNAQFDLSFLSVFMKKHGYGKNASDLIVFDSLTIFRDRAERPHTLTDAARHYGIEIKTAHRAVDDCKTLYEVLLKMEHEKDDLLCYKNLIGYNPKYGVTNDFQVGDARYLPHVFNGEKPLYEQSFYNGYRMKNIHGRIYPMNNALIIEKYGKYGLGRFDYFRGEDKIQWLLPLEYDNIFPVESETLVMYQNNKQGFCKILGINDEDGGIFKTECIYDYIQAADMGYFLKNEAGAQYYRNGVCTIAYKHISAWGEYFYARRHDDTTEIYYGRYGADSLVMLNRDNIPDHLDYIGSDLFYDIGDTHRHPTHQLYHRVDDKIEALPYKFEEEVTAAKGNGLYNTDELKLYIVKGENGYGIMDGNRTLVVDAVFDKVDIELNVNLLSGEKRKNRAFQVPKVDLG